MIQHTPFTNSSTVDGQPEQSNNTKQWTARARWMDGQSKVTTQKLTENLASQEQEQNSTTDHTNHSPGTLRMPAAVLGTMMPDKHNATLTSGRMVQICGFVRSPQFNDLRGEIVSHTHNERWMVKLQDGKTIALKRSNVQTLSPPPADYDMPTHILPSVSSAIYEQASANTPAPTLSPTNTVDNMPKPSAHTLNHSPTSLATLPRMRWSQWDYIAYQEQEDTPGAATQNTTHDKDERSWWAEPGNGSQWQQVVEWKQTEYRTHKWQENIRSVATRNMYQEYEENTEWEPIPTEPTPSTPEGPPPTLRQSPPPSPRAPPPDPPTTRPPSAPPPPRMRKESHYTKINELTR